MELFELKDFVLTFSPQALSIDCFKVLFDRDKNKDKSIALKEMSYIYFFADDRSDFRSIINTGDRTEEIKKAISLPLDWKPDKEVLLAIDFYIKMEETVSSRLLQAGLNACEKLGNFLNDLDLNATDDKGKLIHNGKQIQSLIQDLPKTVTSIITAQKEVKKERESKGDARGSVDKGTFEDLG